jgi:hypothetical protein
MLPAMDDQGGTGVPLFLAARCEAAPAELTPMAELYGGYQAWCAEHRRPPATTAWFGRALARAGYARGRLPKHGGPRAVVGVRLQPPPPPAPGEDVSFLRRLPVPATLRADV